MSQKGFSALLIGLVALIVAWSSLFVISERERAVQLRFGQLVKDDIQPGLHIKIPFVDNVRVFDARLQNLEVPSERFLTLEQKAVIVDSYIKWRIDDVSRFYRATAGDLFRANTLLSQRAESRMRNKFGALTLNEVVSGQRDRLMNEITNELNSVARDELGVTVIDVRVKKIDLPPQVSDSVYERMSSERDKEAQEYRSKGLEMAEGIRANADREQRVIMANAYRDAEMIRGDGDAKAAEIYAKAFRQDPEFYAFTRSLEAYRKSFNSTGDIMLLEPDSDFFNYLNNKSGK
ncbi:membane protease HflC [Endozoicomonas montiporae]|uniref:Protein HflC n=2 Tax=Endozoicomonas montiporae TaxID=1027273 RepID=A0A081MZE3_9GAMM|nr:protease modulator HflC [Endozoicomonas montiporae]AMO54751.1 HflC protein [Endozoicomonas montiporae CL-33]KEQ11566.1 membane protease HflC [Endozoicomonas montiporae]